MIVIPVKIPSITLASRPIAFASYRLSDGVTQSMLATFLSCRERSRLQLNNWEPSHSNTAAFIRGDLVHYALEHWYKNNQPSDIQEFLMRTETRWSTELIRRGPTDQQEMEDAKAMLESVF